MPDDPDVRIVVEAIPDWFKLGPHNRQLIGRKVVEALRQAGRLVCCDMHGRNCEQGGEECCHQCTEAMHFDPLHGGLPCSNPDLSAISSSKEPTNP